MATPFGIEVVTDGPEWLVLRMRVPGLPPAEALTWFTDARKLNRWWGEEALIELRPGGLYEVRWPRMDWVMRGVVALATADTLAYSWSWDHEPDQPARAVIVHASADEAGSVVTVTHGPYQPDESRISAEDLDREQHRDGWLYFLPQLHAMMTAAPAIAGEVEREPGNQLGRELRVSRADDPPAGVDRRGAGAGAPRRPGARPRHAPYL